MYPVDPERQIANVRWKLKVADSCSGGETLLRPRAIMPVVPLARPWRRDVGPHEKRKWGSVAGGPGLYPSVEGRENTSVASSPDVLVRMNGFSTATPHVLLLQPIKVKSIPCH
jgi:hypothetical protein